MQTILQWLYLGIIFWGGPVSWSRIDRTQV
jgi:hypothetical protein